MENGENLNAPVLLMYVNLVGVGGFKKIRATSLSCDITNHEGSHLQPLLDKKHPTIHLQR